MKAVEDGQVPRDSYLIVESLDRLSRDKVLTALSQFTSLIDAGITVVTLMDSQVYSAESIQANPYQLMASIGVMARANEESATKSKRLNESWANKRANASTKPMTARTPEWLRLNKKTGQIEVIPDRAEIVRQLYERTIKGDGAYTLVRWLNDSGIEPWGRGKCKAKAWSTSSVNKVLKQRMVRGEYQPMKRADKHKPDGPPLTGYYPEIVTEDTWLAAQSAMASRHVGGGRVGRVSSLFTRKAVCGYCNAPMRRHESKMGRLVYFVCGAAKYGHGCTESAGMQYREE